MGLLTQLKIAGRNIYRHRGKNLLAAIIIFFASAMFFFSASLVDCAQQAWRNYAATTFLGTYHITALEGLDRDYTLPSMKFPKKNVPASITEYLDRQGIAWSGRIKLGAAVYNSESAKLENFLATLVGVDFAKELPQLTNLEIIQGSWQPQKEDAALVWHELARALGKTVGDELTLFVKDVDGNAYPYTFTITGILGQKKEAGLEGKGVMLIFPLVFADYRHVAAMTGYEGRPMEIAVWDRAGAHQAELARMADAAGLQLFGAEQGFGVLYGMVDMINFIGLILKALVLIVLLVAGLNVNMMSYFDRQKEIGTIIALGAGPGWVARLFLAELVLLATAVYAASGLAYAALAGLTAGGVPVGELATLFAGRNVSLGLVPSSAAAGYGAVLAVIFLSAAYPLWLSMKTNPVEVFREESL